jgi:predicted metal-dependent HD superfamily phosphohydrolase
MKKFDELKKKWGSLARKYSSADLAAALWNEIEKHYTDPGRFYHTLEHIEKLLDLFDEYKTQLSDPDTVQFAIWYHDIIYVPGRGDNEIQSAALAEKRLQEAGVPENQIKTVIQLIEATKSHQLNAEIDNFDGQFFLDADLSILGSEWEDYSAYAANIRKEFSHIPESVYNLGRSGVMKNFLNRERIYLTDDFYQRFEKRARENIMYELELARA